MKIGALLAALGMVACSLAEAQTPVTGFAYVSTPGDYVGQGGQQTFTPPTARFNLSGDTQQVWVGVDEAGRYVNMRLAGPQTLAPGRYPNAGRAFFESPLVGGLDVSMDSRGCNQIKGWFEVLEYEIDAFRVVQKLAVDFMQQCEGTMPPLFGSVRFNSLQPLAVPSLVAVAGMDAGGVAGKRVTLDGSQSFSRTAPDSLSFQWTQTAGPPVRLRDATTSHPSFKAPQVPLEGAPLMFQLRVTDGTGASSIDDVLVLVANPSTPRTELRFSGTAGDYISQGQRWHYDPFNAVFFESKNYSRGASVQADGQEGWDLDLAAAHDLPIRVGRYVNAVGYPSQDPTRPALSLSGDGRRCNTSTGQFTVHQVQFESVGMVSMLDAEFEQHCSGLPDFARGRLLFNAVPAEQLAVQLRAARERVKPRGLERR